MTRIWIENNELDINKGISNQITYAVDDLINIDSKATAFSKTIVLPEALIITIYLAIYLNSIKPILPIAILPM